MSRRLPHIRTGLAVLFELAAVRSGSFLTKIIVLEKIDTASPEPATAGLPLLTQTVAGEDPMQMAQDMGTPLLIVRFGQREVAQEELLARGLFGTVQLPD